MDLQFSYHQTVCTRQFTLEVYCFCAYGMTLSFNHLMYVMLLESVCILQKN